MTIFLYELNKLIEFKLSQIFEYQFLIILKEIINFDLKISVYMFIY